MLNRLIELLNRCQNFGIEEKFTDSGMKEFKIPNDYVANYLIVHGVLALDEEKVNVAMNLRPIATAFGMPLNELAELIRAKEEGRYEEVKHGRWHIMSEDLTDESDCPTEEGWYRIITTDGEEMTDYFFNKPTLIGMGCVYWKDCKKGIRAWAKMDGGKEE